MRSPNGNISCYWPFVRGIHRSPVNSPYKGQWHGALMFSLIFLFETPSRSRWRHCNGDLYDDVIIWKRFLHYCPSVLETTSSRWIPLKSSTNANLWCFLVISLKQAVEQTIELVVLWDANAKCFCMNIIFRYTKQIFADRTIPCWLIPTARSIDQFHSYGCP